MHASSPCKQKYFLFDNSFFSLEKSTKAVGVSVQQLWVNFQFFLGQYSYENGFSYPEGFMNYEPVACLVVQLWKNSPGSLFGETPWLMAIQGKRKSEKNQNLGDPRTIPTINTELQNSHFNFGIYPKLVLVSLILKLFDVKRQSSARFLLLLDGVRLG